VPTKTLSVMSTSRLGYVSPFFFSTRGDWKRNKNHKRRKDK
jgi:hypothetical protein